MASRRKNVKKGVQFTIMVVGELNFMPSVTSVLLILEFSKISGASGTGRTTFVNTLCESEIIAHKVCDNPETAHIEEGIRIKPVNVGE
jgi:cell division control protein 11